jgi:hypothetical protein
VTTNANASGTQTALRYGAQALLYAAFVAVIGYFSTSPPYRHLPAGDALLKLSLTHAGARKEACRERTADELAKLAPNMRAQSVCPRERAPVKVQRRRAAVRILERRRVDDLPPHARGRRHAPDRRAACRRPGRSLHVQQRHNGRPSARARRRHRFRRGQGRVRVSRLAPDSR